MNGIPAGSWHDGIVITARRVYGLATLALLAAAVATAFVVDVSYAALVLAAGIALAAVIRMFSAERDVLTGRGRMFDVLMLLGFALVLVLLSPWGIAELP